MSKVKGFIVTVFFACLVLFAFSYFSASKSETRRAVYEPAELAPIEQSKTVGDAIPPELLAKPSWVGERPYTEQMVALPFLYIPGAVVCPNYDGVDAVMDVFGEWAREIAADKMSHGEERRFHGAPMEKPNAEDYGCMVLPAGTRIKAILNGGVPDVTASVKSGVQIYGVTSPVMLGRLPDEQTSAAGQNEKIQFTGFAKAGKSTPDGALVCPDYNTLTLMNQRIIGGLKQGQPNVDLMSGCDIIPAGQKIQAVDKGQTWHVVGRDDEGKEISGETFGEMVEVQN